MMQPQPMIIVCDVEKCSKWFQEFLGLSSGHGGDEYEKLMDDDAMVAQLHRWDAHEHTPTSATSRTRHGQRRIAVVRDRRLRRPGRAGRESRDAGTFEFLTKPVEVDFTDVVGGRLFTDSIGLGYNGVINNLMELPNNVCNISLFKRSDFVAPRGRSGRGMAGSTEPLGPRRVDVVQNASASGA